MVNSDNSDDAGTSVKGVVITYDMALYAKAVQLVDAPSLPLGGCGMTLILGATLKVRLLFDTQHTVYNQWLGTAVHQ